MTITYTPARSIALRRISAAVGGLAVVAAVTVSTWVDSPAPTVHIDAHQKFEVVTVTANTPPSSPATVTETDKPRQLHTPRATPQVRANRTVMVPP
ncbi:hypothetical protein [Mycobacterium sp. NPDC006124]|uniref:hypothetical protein n=1 Tax=Mycobacterium sp. NPDC006124 TaxID=3156729 RepID=UPI0033AEF8C8